MSSVLHVSEGEFANEVLESKLPVLVDFFADWCAPCRAIGPVLDQLAESYAGRAKIVKINVDEEPGLARQFQVRSIPALMFFLNGQMVGRSDGAPPPAALSQALDQLIAHQTA
jgi:thioredoxin 1